MDLDSKKTKSNKEGGKESSPRRTSLPQLQLRTETPQDAEAVWREILGSNKREFGEEKN
jgi:hypothetical protein